MINSEPAKLDWYLEAFDQRQQRWISLTRETSYQKFHFLDRSRIEPILVSEGTVKECRQWCQNNVTGGFMRLNAKALSALLRPIYHNHAFRITKHHNGLGIFAISLQGLVEVTKLQSQIPTTLEVLWQTLIFGYPTVINVNPNELTDMQTFLIAHAQPEWQMIRLVVWRHN